MGAAREYSPRFRWWFQNLNKGPGREGSILRKGQLWLWWGERTCLEFSWDLWSRACRLSLAVGGPEDDLVLGVAFPPVSIWIACSGLLPFRWLPRDQARETGISIHDGALWVNIWRPEMEWRSDWPWWRSFNVNFSDLLFGRARYLRRELKTERVQVPMPEGVYPATVWLYEVTWRRPRWPFPRRKVFARIKPDRPIPIPGKGENPWDCDDDGIWELSCSAKTVLGAVVSLVESALRDRWKRGGQEWRPEPGREVRAGA